VSLEKRSLCLLLISSVSIVCFITSNCLIFVESICKLINVCSFSGMAIKCYECNSYFQNTCGDWFDNKTYNLVNCGDSVKMCRKVVQEGKLAGWLAEKNAINNMLMKCLLKRLKQINMDKNCFTHHLAGDIDCPCLTLLCF